MPKIHVRHMMKADLLPVLEIERLANLLAFDVPGIGECTALPPFVWREQDFLDAIRQYRCRSKGTFDTRALVALTMSLRDEQTATDVDIELVAGSMVYQIQQEGFQVLRLSAHPADDTVRQALIDTLVETCQASKRRHYVRYVVSDGDWENLRFFVRLGWDRRLLPSYYSDGRDGWVVETHVAVKPPPTANAR